jgi:hypothetical protein
VKKNIEAGLFFSTKGKELTGVFFFFFKKENYKSANRGKIMKNLNYQFVGD